MPDPTTEAGRLRAYLAERFPLASYAVLVALFAGSGSLAAVRTGGGRVAPAVALLVLLAFFHLRVFDEHKDHARDAVTHPERLLSRGVVTLAHLRRWAAVAVVAEAAIAAWLGLPALLTWAAMFLFTVGMRYEFGVGERLNRSLLLYAVTHNPVVALLAMVIWASTGARWDARYLFFVAAASLGSLGFEIARKTRLPSEEIPGADSYSSVYGRRMAGSFVTACVSAAAICGVLLTSRLSDSPLPLSPLLGGLAVARLLGTERRPVKQMELGSSLALLGLFAGIGLAAW
jgi:hypothetical protein